jgi:hypothetical protein
VYANQVACDGYLTLSGKWLLTTKMAKPNKQETNFWQVTGFLTKVNKFNGKSKNVIKKSRNRANRK